MKNILEKIIANQTLTQSEAENFIYSIANESINEEKIVAIIVALRMKGLSLEEVNGFRKALLELAIKLNLDASNAIDLCGTGGDGKNTFNISTTTAFVLSSMGYKVIKHGNYGVSSSCGSSNVLEELGVVFTNDSEELAFQLEENNICFLHAPLFHPTLKKVAKIRTGLGIRTLFNAMGPLVNPIQPAFQLTGTYNLELAKIYQFLLKEERVNYKIVYGMEGFDEATLIDQTRILGKNEDLIIEAKTLKVDKVDINSILGGKTLRESANIVRQILKGKGNDDQNNVIALNTALALNCFHPEKSVKDLFSEAKSFIKSGEAQISLIDITQRVEK